MQYFAYAPEHDLREILRWVNARELPAIDWTLLGPAILRDRDLVFTAYHPVSGGGHASVVEANGRRVAGVIYEIADASVPVFDAFIERVYDSEPSHPIRMRRTVGYATRTGDGEPFDVTLYTSNHNDGRPIPPTPEYMRSLTSFASRLGHSHVWMMHLLSIPTTTGKPEPILYDI